jgi:hypothetical protein
VRKEISKLKERRNKNTSIIKKEREREFKEAKQKKALAAKQNFYFRLCQLLGTLYDWQLIPLLLRKFFCAAHKKHREKISLNDRFLRKFHTQAHRLE